MLIFSVETLKMKKLRFVLSLKTKGIVPAHLRLGEGYLGNTHKYASLHFDISVSTTFF